VQLLCGSHGLAPVLTSADEAKSLHRRHEPRFAGEDQALRDQHHGLASTRSVPLTPSLAKGFERHLARHVGAAPDASVFTGPQGGPLRHSAFYSRLWRPTLRRLELPVVGIHVTRHSAAAGMISAGATPKAVQSVMGHASAAFSLTVYGHLFDADLDALAERLDGQNDGFSSVSRHVRGTDSKEDVHTEIARVADLRQ